MRERADWWEILLPIVLILDIIYIIISSSNANAKDLSGREIAERSRGLRQQIDESRQRGDNRGLIKWIQERVRRQQDAVREERARRAKSRRCLYISSGVCRRQIPTAPSHWSSVKKRRHARQRSRQLSRCRKNCYNREPVQLERRSP